MCSSKTAQYCTVLETYFTVWVEGETDVERRVRIINQVDNFVVQRTEFFENQCEETDRQGNGVTLIEFDCRVLHEDILEGLTTPVGDKHLLSIADKLLNEELVSKSDEAVATGAFIPEHPYSDKEGHIRIDMTFFLKNDHHKRDNYKITRTGIHERVHLADLIKHGSGYPKWMDGPRGRVGHNDKDKSDKFVEFGHYDSVFAKAYHMHSLFGDARVKWPTDCSFPPRVINEFSGWDQTIPAKYCVIKRRRQDPH